ncbi:DUF1343 domain-containing protein [Bacteriovoracaceae bacterium]|nr:DUF1343 domain-containing protein [Bacteriovoracaceae bacterium]
MNEKPTLLSGLDVLNRDENMQKTIKGTVAYLAHNSSVTAEYEHGVHTLMRIFQDRFVKIFGPQHGFYVGEQDNMIETEHSTHSYFQIPVYSLYSETRIPTDEMLEGVDNILIDLQDIGCRDYTYIYTVSHLLEKCAGKDIKVLILDRPNPLNGSQLEGNILDEKFASFIGRHPIPVRHALTMGEFCKMHQKFWSNRNRCNLQVIKMEGWKRDLYLDEYIYPFVPPSPNIPTIESCLTFPAGVLFEGTNLSEGRGTTRPLECLGHPKIKPDEFIYDVLNPRLKKDGIQGITLTPGCFKPTFNKFANETIGAIYFHVTNRQEFNSWRFGLTLLQESIKYLGDHFAWKEPPYEYESEKMPIDIICGTDKVRFWAESIMGNSFFDEMELDLPLFDSQRDKFLLYFE